MSFPEGARVRVGGSAGLSGGGVTPGELTAAVAGLAPGSATYITQTSDGTLTNEQALGDLATGILKSTTSTGVLSIATGADLPNHTHDEVQTSLTFALDGAGGAIPTGTHYTGGVLFPVAMIVTGWYIVGDDDIVVDIQKGTVAGTGYASIAGSERPTLSGGATANLDTNLTTWTTAISALQRVRPNVISATATFCSVTLILERDIAGSGVS